MPDVPKATIVPAERTLPRTGSASLTEQGAAERGKNLEKSCADFEAILVYYMFKTMRQTIPKTNFLKQSAGKDAYEMMLDQKIAEDMANKGRGIGLQKALFEQLNGRLLRQNVNDD